MQKQKIYTKKIGGAAYKVEVHFSKTSKETFTDKLLRLIKNDITYGKKARANNLPPASDETCHRPAS